MRTCLKDLYSNVHNKIIHIIAKNWKQPKCPSTDKWISKLEYIQLMESYLAINRNEPLIQQNEMNKSQTLSWVKNKTKKQEYIPHNPFTLDPTIGKTNL